MKTGNVNARKELIKLLKSIYKSIGVSPFRKQKTVTVKFAESDWNWHYAY